MPAFSLAIFLSAFLLFIVQPLLAKTLLLWFGGSPSVWLSNVLFFQFTLLFGYLYAFFLTKLKSLRWQALIHSVLVIGSMFFLPLTLHNNHFFATWPPLAILCILTISVFLPSLVLSASSPLLQFWYCQCKHTEFPYRYYSLSNFGSLLGLFAYPFALEPWIGLTRQNILWSLVYGIFGFSLFGCLMLIWRERRITSSGPIEHKQKLTSFQVSSWLLLTFLSCSLLLSTTQLMMQNVAGFPLLWVLPLALYLLTFILTFYHTSWYQRGFWVSVYIFFGAGILAITSHHQLLLSMQIMALSLFLFAGCMICHGELVRLKPDPSHLTGYYLAIALGGVLGGIFINLIAPLIFNIPADFYMVVVGILLYASIPTWQYAQQNRLYWRPVIFFVMPLITFCTLIVYHEHQLRHEAIYLHRDFFGSFEVVQHHFMFDNSTQRQLRHGAILHGSQYMEFPKRLQAFTYYGPNSGIRLAINFERTRKNPEILHKGLRIGVIGLGTGTLAALAERGDFMRFYEIDPAVVNMANKYFYYLHDTQAALDIVTGDGRLALKQEYEKSGSEHYDVIAIDAFNGDAIPLHLLTLEALQLYLSHLAPNGILAFHISSRYVDLYPPLQALANSLGLYAYIVHNAQDVEHWISAAEWVLITRQNELGAYLFEHNSLRFRPERTNMLWTDDFHSLLPFIRW